MWPLINILILSLNDAKGKLLGHPRTLDLCLDFRVRVKVVLAELVVVNLCTDLVLQSEAIGYENLLNMVLLSERVIAHPCQPAPRLTIHRLLLIKHGENEFARQLTIPFRTLLRVVKEPLLSLFLNLASCQCILLLV